MVHSNLETPLEPIRKRKGMTISHFPIVRTTNKTAFAITIIQLPNLKKRSNRSSLTNPTYTCYKFSKKTHDNWPLKYLDSQWRWESIQLYKLRENTCNMVEGITSIQAAYDLLPLRINYSVPLAVPKIPSPPHIVVGSKTRGMDPIIMCGGGKTWGTTRRCPGGLNNLSPFW